MGTKIYVQEKFIEQLTDALVDAVEKLGKAPVNQKGEGGKRDYCDPVRESLKVKHFACNLQGDEPEVEEAGMINPSITEALMPAFKAALKSLGHDIHPGQDTHPDENYAWKQNTLSIKSATTISEVWSLSVSGHDLKEKLGQLTEPALRSAATQALKNDIAEIAALNKTLSSVSFYPDR